jgi:hypothetical protein
MDFRLAKAYSDATRSATERLGSQILVWLVFFAILIVSMVVFLLGLGGSMMAMAASADPSTGGNPLLAMGGGFIALIIVFYLVMIAISVAGNAAQCTIASYLRQPNVGDALATGFRSILPLLGVYIPFAIAYFGWSLLLELISPGDSAISVTLGLLTLLVVLYLSTKLSMVVPLVALDGERNPINAVTRSWRMTDGNTLLVFATFLLFYVVVIGIAAALFFGMVMPQAMSLEPPGGGTILLWILLFIVLSAAFTIYAASLTAAVHLQLGGPGQGDLSETFE